MEMHPDPDEIVTLIGVGSYTFRTIVRSAAAGELPPYVYYDLFRDREASVHTLAMAEANHLATLPEFAESCP